MSWLFNKKNKNPSFNIVINFSQRSIEIQEFLIPSLRELRQSIEHDSRASFIDKGEKFNNKYRRLVTDHHDLYERKGGEVYRDYRMFIEATGPAWQIIGYYMTGQEKDKDKVIEQIDTALAIISAIKLKNMEAA